MSGPWLTPQCDLDSDQAIALVRLSDGCAAFPEARFQRLCATHYRSIQPRGSLCILETYPALEPFRGHFDSDFTPCPEHGAAP